MAISVIVPTYKNPDYLDACLKSLIDNQDHENEILIVIDGFYEESRDVLTKYLGIPGVLQLDLGTNLGVAQAHNYGVINATNETVLVINDDNIVCRHWDTIIEKEFNPSTVLTINQIEPEGPSIFDFVINDFGKTVYKFDYISFLNYVDIINKDVKDAKGGIFPFVISKKNYMIVNGLDPIYNSPFVCDWDFFLKLELNGVKFERTHAAHFYHFGSITSRKNSESERFRESEIIAHEIFKYKWGIDPMLLDNNSHCPRGLTQKGISY